MTQSGSRNWAASNIDGLTVVALLYLALPNLIFLVGWFRGPVALVLYGALLHFLWRALAGGPIAWCWRYSSASALVILAVGAGWSAFGGGSHFMYSNPDWIVRDAVLGDLAFANWPVNYLSPEGARLILRSAIGYFLPPAVFGKIFGAEHLALAVYLWTLVGVSIFLFLLPLPGRTGWPLTLGLLLTVFFSGMDFVGQFIATESLPMFPMRLEWWVPLSYPSLTNQLLWAPNHCLPIWIGTLLIFRHIDSRNFLRLSTALLPLTLIWTPFAAIGLIPFATLGAFKSVRKFGWRVTPVDSIASASIFTVPVILFLLLDAGQINSGLVTAPAAGPIHYTHQAVPLRSYMLFVTCEFLFLGLVLAPHVRQSREVFGLALLMLLALPLLRFGPSNDVLLRLCAPPLVVMLVICLQTLRESFRAITTSTLGVACLFLLVGAHTAFNELWRAAAYHRSPANYTHTLAQRQDGNPAVHYVGQLGSSWVAGLLKPLPEAVGQSGRNSH